jgi:hypothetical protein
MCHVDRYDIMHQVKRRATAAAMYTSYIRSIYHIYAAAAIPIYVYHTAAYIIYTRLLLWAVIYNSIYIYMQYYTICRINEIYVNTILCVVYQVKRCAAVAISSRYASRSLWICGRSLFM